MAGTEQANADRLRELLDAALAQADRCGSTLIGAMLAECIDAIDRGRGRTPSLAEDC